MNTPHTILLERAASKKKIPISSDYIMSAYPFHSGRHLGRALRMIGAVGVIALVGVLSSAALGANPAEEMAKLGSGGTDPKGNSWVSIQNSIQQFGHPEFILRLFLSLSLAVACAWAIAWHPRRSSIMNPLSDLEERKALILLGRTAVKRHLYINAMVYVCGRNVNVAAVAFVVFPTGRLRDILEFRRRPGSSPATSVTRPR